MGGIHVRRQAFTPGARRAGEVPRSPPLPLVRELRLMESDMPGFWESLGYHNYGDPWREQRYAGDE